MKAKVLPKSISCGKTFAGRTALTNMTSVSYMFFYDFFHTYFFSQFDFLNS